MYITLTLVRKWRVRNNLKVNRTIERLTTWINKLKNDNENVVTTEFGDFVIEAFGSSVNGFYMHDKSKHSDLDLSISFYSNPTVNKEMVLHTILPAVREVSKENFSLFFEWKVPIIKYTDWETLEEWDLWVNGILGVFNSKLIKAYSNIDTLDNTIDL